MPTNVITGQLPNQLPSMNMNSIPSNLGNIFSSLQGGLIGFPKVNNMVCGDFATNANYWALQTSNTANLSVNSDGQRLITRSWSTSNASWTNPCDS